MSADPFPSRVFITTDAVGGIWNYTLTLVRGLAARGCEVLVAGVGPAPSSDQSKEIRSIPHVEFAHRPFRLEWMEDPWEDVPRTKEWLCDLQRRFCPDQFHFNSYSYAEHPWQAPTVVVGHSCVCSWWMAVHEQTAPDDWNEYRARVAAGLRAAQLVVAPSRAMLSTLRRYYEWSGPGVVISNGASQPRPLPALKDNYIAALGRAWDPAKNLALLDELAPQLSWPILLAGEPTFQARRFASANLRLLGQLPESAVELVLRRAAIFAHPAKYEPFGLSVLEAAAAGNALVLSNLDSLREHWDGAALFADPNRPAEWIALLRRLIADPTLRSLQQRRAYMRAHRFTADKMVDAYLDCYRTIPGPLSPGV